MSPRDRVVYECDHMRLVVRRDEGWAHVGEDGQIGSPCIAGAYRVSAIVTGDHLLSELVTP